MVIKAGCIDDDGKINVEYVPDVEIFTRSRVHWMKPVEGARQEIAVLLRFESGCGFWMRSLLCVDLLQSNQGVK